MVTKRKQKPTLSIGMIFKNEIRCLERCLQSLQPLRQALPCELVMADTGSDDGSRQVAAKYADILFDFPWINDFAAARNAVMDKCCGEWYLSIDADEWLDDTTELVKFLKLASRRNGGPSNKWQSANHGFLIARNYSSYAPEDWDSYEDMYVPRMLRRSTGQRYSGAIHEIWPFDGIIREDIILAQTILHHDGYAGMNINDEAGRAKQERNMTLLRQQLTENPEDLRTLSACVDSSVGDEKLGYAQRLVEMVREKKSCWQEFGPRGLFAALKVADFMGKTELVQEWLALAEEMFPQTYVVRLDMQVIAFYNSFNKEDYADCVRRGELFLQAYADYYAGRGDFQNANSLYYSLTKTGPRWQSTIQLRLACALYATGEKQRSWELLQQVDVAFQDEEQTRLFVTLLVHLQSTTDYDVSPVLLRLWQRISQPDFIRHDECCQVFDKLAANAFLYAQVTNEKPDGTLRPAYTLFLPLLGQSRFGLAAALMEEKSVAELERLLGLVEDWQTLPLLALGRALQAGARFPAQSLALGEMDHLAGCLVATLPQMGAELAAKAAQGVVAASLPDLLWARGLVLAAVQACKWQEEGSLELAQAFAAVEKAFLNRYYAPEMLCAENIRLLPPFHVFGWFCAAAFDALANGDALAYVRLLRDGLELCPERKTMVNFLVDNTPELQAEPAESPELLAMAERVRNILAAYAPDDPAVAALKQSEAYQQVAYLIEAK